MQIVDEDSDDELTNPDVLDLAVMVMHERITQLRRMLEDVRALSTSPAHTLCANPHTSRPHHHRTRHPPACCCPRLAQLRRSMSHARRPLRRQWPRCATNAGRMAFDRGAPRRPTTCRHNGSAALGRPGARRCCCAACASRRDKPGRIAWAMRPRLAGPVVLFGLQVERLVVGSQQLSFQMSKNGAATSADADMEALMRENSRRALPAPRHTHAFAPVGTSRQCCREGTRAHFSSDTALLHCCGGATAVKLCSRGSSAVICCRPSSLRARAAFCTPLAHSLLARKASTPRGGGYEEPVFPDDNPKP